MTERFSNFKREVGESLKGLFSKFTPKQGKSITIVLSLVIALFFLCTTTGRSVIVFIGYLIFILGILLFMYKSYRFASTYSVAVPKPRQQVSDDEEFETDEDEIDSDIEAPLEDNSAIEEANDAPDIEIEDEKVHQVTLDEVVAIANSQEIV